MKKWYVVSFAPSTLQEILSEVEVDSVRIEVYCPMVEVLRTNRGLREKKRVPLLFNYMFFRIDSNSFESEFNPHSISSQYHVRFVKLDNQYGIVSDSEVARIRGIEEEIDVAKQRLTEDEDYLLRFVGQDVDILDGSLKGITGCICGVHGPGVFDVRVLIFNRSTICQVGVDHVRI